MSLGKNQLFYGDNYEILQKYIKDESIDLVYIDPPFNSKRNYNQIYNNIGNEDKAQAQAFVDTWEWNLRAEKDLKEILTGNNFTPQTIDLIIGLEKVLKKGTLLAYLTSMTLRINEMWRVLKPTGSFYLHCDPTASHYLKLLCDTIFCANRGGDFKNHLVWQRTSSHNNANRYGRNNDHLLFYVKDDNKYTFNTVYLDYSEKHLKNSYRYSDEKGKFASTSLTGAGKSSGESGLEWRGINPTAQGRHWATPSWAVIELVGEEKAKQMGVHEKLDLLYDNGLIFFSKNGVPRFKQYLDKMEGSILQENWTDISPISSQAKERLGYPTQKPLALLERIIQASSNEGDTVLDAYCGCGTTVHASQKLNRNWIGIDDGKIAIETTKKRLENVNYEFIELSLEKQLCH